MRCYICNAVLSPEETHYNVKYANEKYGPYDPCGKCLNEIDAAFEDPVEESEEVLEDLEEYEDEIESLL